MDEVWVRVVLVAAVLGLALVVVLWQRRRAGRAVRVVPAGDLSEGVYLFSSTSCRSCESARQTLTSRLGENGFTEFVWQEGSVRFDDLEIGAVPAVLVVAANGSGRLYPGQPDLALRRL